MAVTDDPAVRRFGTLLGEWFAAALQRMPTREEIRIALSELGEMQRQKKEASTAEIAAAFDRIAVRLGVSRPVMP